MHLPVGVARLACDDRPELVRARSLVAGADSLFLVSRESGPPKQPSASRLARDDLLDCVLDLHHPDLPGLNCFALSAPCLHVFSLLVGGLLRVAA